MALSTEEKSFKDASRAIEIYRELDTTWKKFLRERLDQIDVTPVDTQPKAAPAAESPQ